MSDPVQVAIDGLAGAGKSTVARSVAVRLSADYLDTGAMYRAVTAAVLAAGIDVNDVAGVADLVAALVIDISTHPGASSIEVDGRDVAVVIRSPAVTAAVSAVSSVAEVRAAMVARQRDIAAAAARSGTDIVVEGRDIGAEVLPDAAVKVFLVASAHARARRRQHQDQGIGHVMGLSEVQASLERRDRADSTRHTSPLRAAPGASIIDSTELGVEGVVAQILTLVERARVPHRVSGVE